MHHRDISDGKYNWTDKQKRRWRARGVTLGFEETLRKESECASKREDRGGWRLHPVDKQHLL
jgi:hypothetical protein